jgi:hypothetical protein
MCKFENLHDTSNGSDIHDKTRLALSHMRNYSLGHANDGEEIGLEGLFKALYTEIQEWHC